MVLASTKPETLVTTYLEMTSKADFRPGYIDDPSIEIVRMNPIDLRFYLFMYQSVGEDYSWRDRLIMPRSELREILASPSNAVFVLFVGGAPAGYVELNKEKDHSVEVAYFGLRPDYMGRGLGKHLLSYGIEMAWEMGARRVWVHTCNLDAPHALDNYKKRGFRVYETHEETMPERYL